MGVDGASVVKAVKEILAQVLNEDLEVRRLVIEDDRIKVAELRQWYNDREIDVKVRRGVRPFGLPSYIKILVTIRYDSQRSKQLATPWVIRIEGD